MKPARGGKTASVDFAALARSVVLGRRLSIYLRAITCRASHPAMEISLGWWMLHSMASNLLWELDLGRKRGHVARGSGCLCAGVRGVLRGAPRAAG
jgi:hypothetical protein